MFLLLGNLESKGRRQGFEPRLLPSSIRTGPKSQGDRYQVTTYFWVHLSSSGDEMGGFPRSRTPHTVGHPPTAASRTRNATLNQFSFASPFFSSCEPPQQKRNLRIHHNSGTWDGNSRRIPSESRSGLQRRERWKSLGWILPPNRRQPHRPSLLRPSMWVR